MAFQRPVAEELRVFLPQQFRGSATCPTARNILHGTGQTRTLDVALSKEARLLDSLSVEGAAF